MSYVGRILDAGLADRGEHSYLWARMHMPVLHRMIEKHADLQPLGGLVLGSGLQVTKETSVLLMGAKRLGARVVASSGNPLTTQDDIAAFLQAHGVEVFAWSGQTQQEFERCTRSVMMRRPDMLVDDGAGLGILAHTDPDLQGVGILGGTEETATGVSRMGVLQRAGLLRYPVIAVNDSPTKYLFDSRHGTGQSVVDGILRAAGVLVASKRAVVAGYGWVGKGVASRLAGLGARVIVTEVDPVRALEAHLDGFEVATMASAARTGEIFVTCTGMKDVISRDHLDLVGDGSIVCNAGHFDVEIDAAYLLSHAARRINSNLDECLLPNGRRIFLVSQGRVANLASAEGHPPEVMDLSFCNQLGSLLHLAANPGLPNVILPVPDSINSEIARAALLSSGIRIDSLRP